MSEGFGTGTGFDAVVVGLLLAGPGRVLDGCDINDDLLGFSKRLWLFLRDDVSFAVVVAVTCLLVPDWSVWVR